MTAWSFPELLARNLAHEPGRPFITWYDGQERVELSVATWANWVHKTTNLLLDEYLLDPGDTVLIDLPRHWLVPIWMGAAWQAGIAVTDDASLDAALVVCGPDPDDHVNRGVPVVSTALLPFAVRHPAGPPDGCDDYGLLWPSQPDALMVPAQHDPDAVAVLEEGEELTQARLFERAAEATWDGTRLLTDVHPMAAPVDTLGAALVRQGSLVLAEVSTDLAETERVSDTLEQRVG